MTAAPMLFEWTDDGHMVPLPRFRSACDRSFVVGEKYTLDVIEERSGKHERFFHASLQEAWKNLPETTGENIHSYDDFRRYCLIKTGWHTMQELVFSSQTNARDVRRVLEEGDEYCIVVMEGRVVRRWKARSQKRGAMSKEDFKASANAVLEYAASLINVKPQDLAKNAERVA